MILIYQTVNSIRLHKISLKYYLHPTGNKKRNTKEISSQSRKEREKNEKINLFLINNLMNMKLR